MAQIGNVKEINEVKKCLNELKEKGYIIDWELPYENLLTRLSAAIFFLSINDSIESDLVWGELSRFDDFTFELNTEMKLSKLQYQVEFRKESNEGM